MEPLGGEVIPRSVLFAEFEGAAFLLVALGDGHLFNWSVQADTGEHIKFLTYIYHIYSYVVRLYIYGVPPTAARSAWVCLLL